MERRKVIASKTDEARGSLEQEIPGDEVTVYDEHGDEEKLNISSDQFDPLLALYSDKTPLPYPNIKCFNNIAEYESFLRGKSRAQSGPPREKKEKRGRRPAPDPARIERLKDLILPEKRAEAERARTAPRRNKAPKNVLTRMQLHEGSPLGELHRCVRDRIKVNVHIRTFKGLRGVCSGFLVAFDKFWNMALVDVDETYRKPILGKAFYNEPKLNVTQLFERLQLQETLNVAIPDKATYLTGSSGSVREAAKTADKQKSMSSNDKLDFTVRSTLVLDPSVYKASKERKSAETSAKDYKFPHAGHQENTKQCRTKVDYQKVFRRHLSQLFIRGESILLVHLAQ